MLKKGIIFTLLLLHSLATLSAEPLSFDKELQGQADSWRSQFNAPGLSISIFNERNHKLTNVTSGFTENKINTPVIEKTLFNFSSIAKQFVAVAFLQMQNEGKLEIDQTVTDVIEQHDAMATTNFNKQWTTVTIRQLLNMTSGLSSYWDDPIYQARLFSKHTPVFYKSQNDLINISINQAHYFQPGQGWRYSDTNYLVLAKLIELINKRTFSDEMIHRFQSKDKMALKSTFWSQSSSRASIIPEHVPKGYNAKDDEVITYEPLGDGARFLLSNTNDMAYWIASIFNNSLLDSSSMDELSKVVSKETGQFLHSEEEMGYSFALDRVKTKEYGTIWFYPGNSAGFTTFVAWIPKLHISVAVALNKEVNFDELFNQVTAYLQATYSQTILEKQRSSI